MIATALLTIEIVVGGGTPVVPPPPPPSPERCTLDLDDVDRLLLARLLVAEVRGIAPDVQARMAAGVLDTVCLRTTYRVLSKGSVWSTLAWHSGTTWQFPPWVVYGCDGLVPSACLDGWDIAPFVALVRAWERGSIASGLSRPHLYYHSLAGQPALETITAPDGRFISWHDGWY